MDKEITRRTLIGGAALTGVLAGIAPADAAGQSRPARKTNPPRRSILNFNENMEYRRLGKTGLMVSAVCLGGHWKRIGKAVPGIEGCGYCKDDEANLNHPGFIKNRHDVVSRCIEVGINYIDACNYFEAKAYSRALKGRREKMYLGFSWSAREPRRPEYRTWQKLMETIDTGLRDIGQDYVDLWRISLPQEGLPDLSELARIEEATFTGLERAQKQGKVRFTGISTHNRTWLKSVIQEYPKQLQVVCTPYTANTKELPTDSVFAAIRKYDVGFFGIKPFADNALFKGDSAPNSPHREEDNQRARLAIRYILNNPAISAPIPGLITLEQVDNAARAVMERRKLDLKEVSRLEQAGTEMWANLRPSHRWLKDWEYA
ncbi:MAG: aldo/keto reductase [Bryobacteraceae bacterium]|nr:aldo/keto reductase [Bryobacteraceae bacterium]